MFLTEKNFKYYHTGGIFREYRNKCFWRPKAQAGIFREYRNQCFWRPNALKRHHLRLCPLRILSGKGAVQIVSFRKLGGKCHFLLRFCTRNWSETYMYATLSTWKEGEGYSQLAQTNSTEWRTVGCIAYLYVLSEL